MSILIPVLALTGLGVIFGAGLAWAAKKLSVHSDPRIEKVYALLAGANCGSCGYPGCLGFAEALVQGATTVDKCVVTPVSQRAEIAKILGVELNTASRKVAVLHCHGGSKRVKDKYSYSGIKDCLAANLIMAGPKECIYGCIGYGSCVKVCPFGAITMSTDGLPRVSEDKCTACGKCVSACPKKLFTLVEIGKGYNIRCKSLYSGKKVMEVCSVGCITCGKCVKACPVSAIKLVDNLAVIDYGLCKDHGECFKVCPVNAIAKKENKGWVNKLESK